MGIYELGGPTSIWSLWMMMLVHPSITVMLASWSTKLVDQDQMGSLTLKTSVC